MKKNGQELSSLHIIHDKNLIVFLSKQEGNDMANMITLKMLIEKKACQEQVDIFKQYFGESVEITEDICLKYSNEFHINRLIDNMFNEEQRELYYTIQAPAYAAYKATEWQAWKDYIAIEAPAYKAFKAIQEPAWKDYYTIQEPAHTKYEKSRAKALFIAYNS